MFVSDALAVVHVLKLIGGCLGAVYTAAVDNSSELSELVQLGLAVSSARTMYMVNKKHALDLIQVVALVEADLLGMRDKEVRGSLSSEVQAHLRDLARQLNAAQKLVQSVIMPASVVSKGWLAQKAWIVQRVAQRATLQEQLQRATAAVVRSCQLLHFGMQVQAQSVQDDADDGRAEDAASLTALMREQHREMDDEIGRVLSALQQSGEEQANRIISVVEANGCGVRAEIRQQCAEVKAAILREMHKQQPQPAALTSLALPCVKEDEGLTILRSTELGDGTGGMVYRARFRHLDGHGNGKELNVAFKEIKTPFSQSARKKAEFAHDVRREAKLMWAINGHPNCVKLYALCTQPMGLVLELCTGSMEKWLWAEQRKMVQGRRVLSFIPNHLLPHDTAASNHTSRAAKAYGDDSDEDADIGLDDETYESMLAEGKILGCLSQMQRIIACEEVICGLSYVHGRHMSHKDIKAENVLVQQLAPGAMCFKLADFGSAKLEQSWSGSAGSTINSRGKTGGTERWQPRETLNRVPSSRDDSGVASTNIGSETSQLTSPSTSSSSSAARPTLTADDRLSDVYSLILVIASILTSLPPYAAHVRTGPQLSHAINSGTPPFDPLLLRATSPDLEHLVRLSMQESTRPTLLDIRFVHWPGILKDLLASPKSSQAATKNTAVTTTDRTLTVTTAPRPALSPGSSAPIRATSQVAAVDLPHPAASLPSAPSSVASLAAKWESRKQVVGPGAAERTRSSDTSPSAPDSVVRLPRSTSSNDNNSRPAVGTSISSPPPNKASSSVQSTAPTAAASTVVLANDSDSDGDHNDEEPVQPSSSSSGNTQSEVATTSTSLAQSLLRTAGVLCDMQRTTGGRFSSNQSAQVRLYCTATELSWHLVKRRPWDTNKKTYWLPACSVTESHRTRMVVRVDKFRNGDVVEGASEVVSFMFPDTDITVNSTMFTQPVRHADVVAVVEELIRDVQTDRPDYKPGVEMGDVGY